MNIDTIFPRVCEIIDGSVGRDKNSIRPDDTLFDDLGIDSIDMVDILYELETAFGIELKVSDFEARAREAMKDKPLEIDGVITPDGLAVIREHMTEVNPQNLVEGITIHQLIKLFTVKSLCKLILHKLEENQLKSSPSNS
jgi:acyl carrier protein